MKFLTLIISFFALILNASAATTKPTIYSCLYTCLSLNGGGQLSPTCHNDCMLGLTSIPTLKPTLKPISKSPTQKPITKSPTKAMKATISPTTTADPCNVICPYYYTDLIPICNELCPIIHAQIDTLI